MTDVTDWRCGAPEIVRFAAAEMTNFLSRAFGSAVPVVDGPTAGRIPIFLGTNAWSQAAGLAPERLPRDGFETVIVGGERPAVYLAGCDDASYVRRALNSACQCVRLSFRNVRVRSGKTLLLRGTADAVLRKSSPTAGSPTGDSAAGAFRTARP